MTVAVSWRNSSVSSGVFHCSRLDSVAGDRDETAEVLFSCDVLEPYTEGLRKEVRDMRGHVFKGCAVALAIVLLVLAVSTLADACGRCNAPCSWTWSYSGCCYTRTYVSQRPSCYCGGWSPCYSYCYKPYLSCYSCYRPCSCVSYYYRSTCYHSTCEYRYYSCCP